MAAIDQDEDEVVALAEAPVAADHVVWRAHRDDHPSLPPLRGNAAQAIAKNPGTR
jgi:hypothetical protein